MHLLTTVLPSIGVRRILWSRRERFKGGAQKEVSWNSGEPLFPNSRVVPSFEPSEAFEVEFVPGQTEVFDDVRDNAPRHVTRMPGEGDQPFGLERIGIVPVAARRTKVLAANSPEPAFQLPAIP